MSRILNNKISTHVLDPDNCHCTYRELQGGHSAIAKDLNTHENVAYVYWNANKDHYCVRVIMTIGNKFEVKVYNTDSDEEIDSKIEALFVLMDNAWNN